MLKRQLGRLGKNMFIYGVGGAANRFLNLLLLPVFTAYLSPKDYGIISILAVVSLLVTPIFSLGFGAAITPYYYEENSQKRKETTIWTAFTILIVSTSLLATLGIVFSRHISKLAFQTSEFHELVTVSLLSTCLRILIMPLGLYFRFEERAKMFVALTAISSLTSIGLSLLMVIGLHEGAWGMIWGQFMAQVVTIFLYLLVTVPRLRFQVDLILARKLLHLGVPLIPSFAFLYFLQHGNKYVLQWFHGLDAVGVYTIGFNLGLAMAILVSAFNDAWVPYFMSFMDKKEEARVLFGRLLTYYSLGFGVVNLLFFIFAKPVVMIMTQPAFHEAYKVVGFSASAQFLIGVFHILLPGIYFSKDVKHVTLVQAGAVLAAIGFDLWLIPPFGMLGAAIALMLGTLALVILMQMWNYRQRDKYLEIQYEWGRVFSFGLIYVAFMIGMLWERNLSLSGEVALSMVMTTFILSALYVLLNSSERQMIRSIPGRFRLRIRLLEAYIHD